jgi:16S rRNA (uracil1498-N3)-methyltransferase
MSKQPSIHRSQNRPRRLFYDSRASEQVSLTGDQARHGIKVLRLKAKDTITVFDGQGFECTAHITHVCRQSLRIDLKLETWHRQTQPSLHIHLGVAHPKGERASWLVEKFTELGGERLTWIQWHRSLPTQVHKKGERYQKIASEAARQSGRAVIPRIDGPVTLDEFRPADENSLRLVGEPSALNTSPLKLTEDQRSVTLLVGPEGGLEAQELVYLKELGYKGIIFNPWVLRIETAALAGMAWIMSQDGNVA